MKRFFRPLKPGPFFRAVGVLAGGTAIAQLISLGASPILSRLFGPDAFGVLAVFVAVLTVAVAIGSLRLEQAVGLPRSEQVAFNIMTLAVLGALVTAVALAVIILLAPHLLFPASGVSVPKSVMWLLPVSVVLASFYQVLNVWALRSRAFRPIAGTQVAQSITIALSQTVAGLFGLGAIGLTSGYAIGQSIGAGTLFARTVSGRNIRRPRLRELRAALVRYRRFPLLATPAALMNTVSQQLPTLLLAAFFGAGVAGQYFFSARITIAPLGLIGGSIGKVFYADAVALGRGRPAALRSLVLRTSIKSFFIGLVPGLLIAVLAPALFPIVFGAEWEQAGQISQALTVLLIANFAVSPVTQIFLIVEHQILSVVVNAVRLIVVIAATLLPVSGGLDPVGVIFVYSCAMAMYHIATLLVAVLLLTVMHRKLGEGVK